MTMSAQLDNDARRALLGVLRDLPDLRTARGRQALVENAVAGYPRSHQLLANLDWEGSAMVFASDLIRWSEGFEVAEGIEALPLLVTAIEPMVSAESRAALQRLKRQQGWGVDVQSSPAEPWWDDRSPSELNLERIIGENTLRHINMLHKALRAANAVVRIALPGQGYGTGFMVSDSLMMTNHHVIADAVQAAAAEATFFHELDIDGRRREETVVGTAPDALLYTDAELDVSLVRLQDPPPFGRALGIRPARIERDQRVAIIQHPGGYLKKISLQNNFVAFADDRLIQYYTSTEAGSSGSPVLDDDFGVIGLHRGYIELEEPDPGERYFRNQGSTMIAILRDLERAAPELVKALTILS
jgi:hypothetical protein